MIKMQMKHFNLTGKRHGHKLFTLKKAAAGRPQLHHDEAVEPKHSKALP